MTRPAAHGAPHSDGAEAAGAPGSPSRSLVVPHTPDPGRGGASGAQSDAKPSLASFAAQLFGQPGRKRGLKGGPPVLEAAKSAYLEAEYSGPNDRRARTGRITKTEI